MNLFDSLDSVLVQGLELPGIFFGIYILTTYILSCLSIQLFNPITSGLRPTSNGGPSDIRVTWGHLSA